eukprot:SAG11_NODE_2249_length_3634_cov_12.743140_2_plen_252_part_00
MSFWYSSRTDDVYAATSLQNWQRPRVGPAGSAVADATNRPWQRSRRNKNTTPSVTQDTRPALPGPSPSGNRDEDGLTPNFLVDGNGHLLPGKKRSGRSSFNSCGYDGFRDAFKGRNGSRGGHAVGSAGHRAGKDQFGSAVGYLVANEEWPPQRNFPFPIGSAVLLDGTTAAKVAFHGRTEFAAGEWVGLLLASPTGRNDGCVGGRRYFRAESGHGLFIRAGSKRLRPMSAVVRQRTPSVKYDDRLRGRFGR